MWIVKGLLVSVAILIAMACLVIPLYLGGYISRPLVIALSPDGSTEAVCRGWYPDQTDYELWLRRRGEWFGRRIGKVGGESAGRCGGVAWSSDGSRVAVTTQSGWMQIYDAQTLTSIGTQWLHEVGEPGTVPTPRMVTGLAFESDSTMRLTMCSRQWPHPRDVPYYACGPELASALIPIQLEPPRSRPLRTP